MGRKERIQEAIEIEIAIPIPREEIGVERVKSGIE
jgi:hypothetical protein